jgi:4-hydroxy-3-methylbut-2-enyl diphosphate reductase
MKITIDPAAGFCFGVERAISIAEKELQNEEVLFCLGEIVHNKEEVKRLENKGLRMIDHSGYKNISDRKVLFRAHGEPPETYKSKGDRTQIIDATCPIVLNLQKKVKSTWLEIQRKNGQILIYGKKDHPEVVGLSGQTNHNAIIVEQMSDIDRIDFGRPARLFAQTTKDKNEYTDLITAISEMYKNKGGGDFQYYNSICGYVSGRIPKLKDFCKKNEVIVFVSGKNSSNGKYLYGYCKDINPKTYHISNPRELEKRWFDKAKSTGISGATSTPRWLMEEVAEKIADLV